MKINRELMQNYHSLKSLGFKKDKISAYLNQAYSKRCHLHKKDIKLATILEEYKNKSVSKEDTIKILRKSFPKALTIQEKMRCCLDNIDEYEMGIASRVPF